MLSAAALAWNAAMVSARSAVCSSACVGGSGGGDAERDDDAASSSAAARRCDGSVSGLSSFVFFFLCAVSVPDLLCSSVRHPPTPVRKKWFKRGKVAVVEVHLGKR